MGLAASSYTAYAQEAHPVHQALLIPHHTSRETELPSAWDFHSIQKMGLGTEKIVVDKDKHLIATR